jgi:opacity protein-like surface antigen
MGIGLSVGGGVDDFVGDAMRDTTSIGGSWNVRMTFGTQFPLAAEVSYIGSAQSINALGLDNDAVLLGNGVQADLRLNATTSGPFQPFIFAGAAWRRYDLTNTQTNTSDISDSDDVVEFPVGAGVAYHYQGFIVDARGEFRAATNEDLMPSLSNDITQDSGEASLHRWGVNATVGYEF